MNFNFLKYASASAFVCLACCPGVQASSTPFSPSETCEEESSELPSSFQQSVSLKYATSPLEDKESDRYGQEGVGQILGSSSRNFITRETAQLEEFFKNELISLNKETQLKIDLTKSEHEESLSIVTSSVFEKMQSKMQPLRNTLELLGADSEDYSRLEDILARTGSEFLAVLEKIKEENRI